MIPSSIYRLSDYVAFRTTKRYNQIRIKSLSPNYYDKDTLLLHGVMQLVVDFVEIELAAYKYERMTSLKARLYKYLPWCLRSSEWIRSPQLGLEKLNEECEPSLTPEETAEIGDFVERSAENYRRIRTVYLWWTQTYPKRVSPEVASGWAAIYEEMTNLSVSLLDTPAIVDFGRRQQVAIEKCAEIERKYFDEDTEMLILAIRTRESMWT